jgi:hypothetical protein
MAKNEVAFVELILRRTREDIKKGHYGEWR